MPMVDTRLTRELKAIVAAHGWPTISLVGIEASQAAALILIHSPDHDFQRRLIPELERLVKDKKIVGADVATLIDKTLVAEGRRQRYGTQYSWKGEGPMSMDPVEDPAGLEQRRKAFLLPPLAVYDCYMRATYHRDIR